MLMKVISKEQDPQGKTILVCEQRLFFFWKRTQKFLATREFPKGYWEWLRFPNMNKLWNDKLSFQLDAWNKIYKIGPCGDKG
jgi:hypothetical protein